MTGWRKLFTVSVPAALIAAVFAQTAIELWVRARWDPRRGRPGFFLSDPVRGQRLAANYDGWFAGVPVHTNRLELRDPREYALAKRPNTFRILVLGDSVTFGHGSLYETTYPYLLEQRLKRWRPEIDWQVWNAAVPGYNTSQELAHLLEVGDRFRPDLVIVGFFVNDLTDNAPIPHPGRLTVAAYRLLSYARRHLYSLELYKQVYLTARWRLSGSDEYRRRVEHLGTEEGLLARTSDASVLREQQLTDFTRLSDDQVASIRCIGGMKPSAELLPAMQREPGYKDWLAAVRELQRLDSAGRFRVVFFVNDAPPICPDGDYYYDGARAMHEFFLAVLGARTPVVSCYEAFLHTVPSQMPNADGHSIGNANVVKADVLFGFLSRQLLSGHESGAPGSNVRARR
ncbi:MAG TPA: GDSL-type esterase/lipase family protein [Vicinamibacterales bacterium]|nr:GDSL-type esterase/lipase family protein [Vicinamibacterales bacterium]